MGLTEKHSGDLSPPSTAVRVESRGCDGSTKVISAIDQLPLGTDSKMRCLNASWSCAIRPSEVDSNQYDSAWYLCCNLNADMELARKRWA